MLFTDFKPPIGYVYVARKESGEYKIGSTESDLRDRLIILGGEVKEPFLLVRAIPTECPKLLERRLHDRFFRQAVGHEWFVLGERDASWLLTAPPDEMRGFVPESRMWYTTDEANRVCENLIARFYRTMGPSGYGGRIAKILSACWDDPSQIIGTPTDAFRESK